MSARSKQMMAAAGKNYDSQQYQRKRDREQFARMFHDEKAAKKAKVRMILDLLKVKEAIKEDFVARGMPTHVYKQITQMVDGPIQYGPMYDENRLGPDYYWKGKTGPR